MSTLERGVHHSLPTLGSWAGKAASQTQGGGQASRQWGQPTAGLEEADLFPWRSGHSGVVLTEAPAATLGERAV